MNGTTHVDLLDGPESLAHSDDPTQPSQQTQIEHSRFYLSSLTHVGNISLLFFFLTVCELYFIFLFYFYQDKSARSSFQAPNETEERAQPEEGTKTKSEANSKNNNLHSGSIGGIGTASIKNIQDYENLVNDLRSTLEIEKDKARTSDRAYSLLHTKFQGNQTALLHSQAKEKEYLSRIYELEHNPDEKYKDILKEKNSLKIRLEELKTRLDKQSQIREDNVADSRSGDNNIEKKQEHLAQVCAYVSTQQHLKKERDACRARSEKAQIHMQQIMEALKRAEESKIKLIQETTEQMNKLRFYLKLYGKPTNV
ncbi:hypothetical protein RFI_17960 [Reticulomyxa filosa]|uniref:Uncharacterized protein n=1 Tax=Reticulomyxa filosa TaxID=46433 RepID=X6N0J9_RETFI|nr:hypothetical protein RFI_17960 [Reticulomyxa filosa]|eukprot:ETO19269.1 hypothetical protein RFI_17960 [Reticulomyxa filosa]